MTLDGGVLTICELVDTAAGGAMPALRLMPRSRHYYGERTVGYGRQYAAKGVNEQVDMLVRVWRDRNIRIGMYAIVGDEQYRLNNVQHLLDGDGLQITDLSLQRLGENYDIAREN
nr:MAG TPA: hypothetical protein [Caudoviricetes sp.]